MYPRDPIIKSFIESSPGNFIISLIAIDGVNSMIGSIKPYFACDLYNGASFLCLPS